MTKLGHVPIHVQGAVLDALRETTEKSDAGEINQVIEAAVWAFSQKEEWSRHRYVTEFWMHGIDEFPSQPAPKGALQKLAQCLREFLPGFLEK